MKVRYAAWGLVFFALVAGAWYALQPPQLADAPAANVASGAPSVEARAAAMPTSSKLGTSAVLSIDHERRRIGLSMAASDGGTAADVAEVARAQPSARLGTFADLLKKR